eukprot:Trichotokara_eunicae@DN4394_c0_g1_i2.p1
MFDELKDKGTDGKTSSRNKNWESDSDDEGSSEPEDDTPKPRGLVEKDLVPPDHRATFEAFTKWSVGFDKEMRDSGVWPQDIDPLSLTGKRIFENLGKDEWTKNEEEWETKDFALDEGEVNTDLFQEGSDVEFSSSNEDGDE